MADIFAAVDFSTVATWVSSAGVSIIGIAMAFKGISLGKRAVNRA
jgi:SAM-dependent MidA family methyltransferase